MMKAHKYRLVKDDDGPLSEGTLEYMANVLTDHAMSSEGPDLRDATRAATYPAPPPRIYDSAQLEAIAKLYSDLERVFTDFEPGFIDGAASTKDDPLYIFGMEIVIRHRSGNTVGRIGMDDCMYFEFTDENYGEKGTSAP